MSSKRLAAQTLLIYTVQATAAKLNNRVLNELSAKSWKIRYILENMPVWHLQDTEKQQNPGLTCGMLETSVECHHDEGTYWYYKKPTDSVTCNTNIFIQQKELLIVWQ